MDTFNKNHIISIIHLNTEIVISSSDVKTIGKTLKVDYADTYIQNGDHITMPPVESGISQLRNHIRFLFQIVSMKGYENLVIYWKSLNPEIDAPIFSDELEKYRGVCKKIIFVLEKNEYEVFLKVL
jgi:hypothetical protein